MKVYSKPSGPVLRAKTAFVDRNAALHERALAVNAAYRGEALRTRCKICAAPLGETDFVSFTVPYALCGSCGHLNGRHEDGARFAQALYADDGGANYKENYLSGYDARVRDIYRPKLDFLLKVLSGKVSDRAPVVLDVGCGGGHFVKACEEADMAACGIDPNAALVALGSEKLARNTLETVSLDAFETRIRNTDASVVTMIGVLEHLRDPQAALQAFASSRAQALFISVPLFSLSVFLEHCFPQIYPRHLSGAHTHLFTPESLEHIERTYGFERVGEWWFGSDMMDLHRAIGVTLRSGGASDRSMNALDARFAAVMDELQHVLDRNHLCSEVHLVWGKV